MNERVVLREFSSRTDAEIVRELLEANGIEGFVTSDDCGSVDPALQFARGALLLVDAKDLLAAEQIISESRDDTPGETAEDDPEP
jgi:hypothetical protein